MPEEGKRCLNCGHRMGLHWTGTLQCRLAGECLCQQWMGEYPRSEHDVWRDLFPETAKRYGRPATSTADEYRELIDSVTAEFR